MNQLSNLAYSRWHRTLGYSYFAMDIDYIEIKNNQPVAIIESSLCTAKISECEGPNGVFNRFLKETGGFQLEMTYWVSKWLNVPAFIVCIKPSDFKENEQLQVLSLDTGENKTMTLKDYELFINGLPDINNFFFGEKLELPKLLEKLVLEYPGIRTYPYFNDGQSKTEWMENYHLRNKEIRERKVREPLSEAPKLNIYPVKSETTNDRPKYYDVIREQINPYFVNLEWVEWRKDSPKQKIGRPAALIKTQLINGELEKKDFETKADEQYCMFKNSDEYIVWCHLSKTMSLDWFFVTYTLDKGEIGGKSLFKVWKNGEEPGHITSENGYRNFLTRR